MEKTVKNRKLEEDKRSMLDMADNLISVRPVTILLLCIFVFTFVLKYFFGFTINEDKCLLILGIYAIYMLIFILYTGSKVKNFMGRYFPNEYNDLYKSDSITSWIKTPLGTLKYLIYSDKVLSNREQYDETFVRLMENIDDRGHTLLFLYFGGFIALGVYLMVVIA